VSLVREIESRWGIRPLAEESVGSPQAARRTRPLEFTECGPRFLGSTSHVRVPQFTHHPFDLYLNNLSAYHVSVAFESQVYLRIGDPSVADKI
jgi:hypothetical protein